MHNDVTRTAEARVDDQGLVRFYDPSTNEEIFIADRKIHPLRWRLLAIWIVIFSLGVGYGLRVQREQTNDIQSSRLHSCRASYEGIREVFKPFFRDPKLQTAKEKADQKKFNTIIDKRKRNCSRTVSVSK